MQHLSEKEWIFLNEIFHMIHDTESLTEMRVALLDLLAVLIPNSSASFYLADNHDGKLLSDPVARNMEQRDIINYLAYGEGLDYTIPLYKNPRPFSYRETDLFDNRVRENTEFYNDFLAHGMEYPMALCIARGGKCCGALSLYRSKKMGDFGDRDLFILNQLHNHLATRISLNSSPNDNPLQRKLDEIQCTSLLTTREMEIATLILQGFSNEEIGSKLFIEPGTVKKHVHNIYGKFEVKNRMQLLRVFL